MKINKKIKYIIEKLGWKRLSGFSNEYYCNPHEGKIYSTKSNGKLKELKDTPGSNGYCKVKLKCSDGKYHDKSTHRLIIGACADNPNNKPLVHHKNHDRTDNRLSNLEHSNHKENSRRRKDNDKTNYA